MYYYDYYYLFITRSENFPFKEIVLLLMSMDLSEFMKENCLLHEKIVSGVQCQVKM